MLISMSSLLTVRTGQSGGDLLYDLAHINTYQDTINHCDHHNYINQQKDLNNNYLRENEQSHQTVF